MTLRKRVRRLADRHGLTDVDPAPRTAPARPGAGSKNVELGPGMSLVADGDVASALKVHELTDDAWLVDRGAALDAADLGGRGWLVSRRDASSKADLRLIQQTLKQIAARHVVWLLDRYQVDCVLDIGANDGRYAAGLRRNGYRGHIASFEPVPGIGAALAKRAASDDRWSVHHMALGSTAGTVPMHVQRTFSSLLPSTEYGRERFSTLQEHAGTKPVDVPVRRLDSVLDEILAPVVAAGVKTPRLYLKMDTQGFDLEVFRGAGARIGDVVGLQSELALLLIYEQMPRMPESVATYEDAGFEITGLYPVTREKDGRVIEFDCLMVRADACPS